MWAITDHRMGTTKVHFADSEAKRDARRIYRRNMSIASLEHEKQSAKSIWADAREYHMGNETNDEVFPPRTFSTGEDFDLPFTPAQWGDLFDSGEDLTNGPAMTVEEYLNGQEAEGDDTKAGLALLGGDENDEVDDVLASLSDDDDEDAMV